MAKYCERCGKPLPKGTDQCPDCAAASREQGAALFTTMHEDPAHWKTEAPVKKPKTAQRSRMKPKSLLCLAAGCALTVLLVILVLLCRPTARVTRSIRSGDYDKALEIYWNSARLPEGERVSAIDRAIQDAADTLCTQYANGELDSDTAASQLAKLGTFGDGSAQMLEDTYAYFRSLNASESSMAEAEKLFSAGQFLEAREAYLRVVEGDADYETAMARAENCLKRYADAEAASAEELMRAQDYPAALSALKNGIDTLYTRYGSFSERLDALLVQCRADYENTTLEQVRDLEAREEYDLACAALQACIDVLGTEREALTEALEKDTLRASSKIVADAEERAEEYYLAEQYADAFAELDSTLLCLDEEQALKAAKDAIRRLEERFAEDMVEKAEDCYGGDRAHLKGAIAILDDALDLRDLEPMKTYREDISRFLPVSLVEMNYTAKTGTVFRSEAAFEAMDGNTYSDGWIWGADGAEISYRLDGEFDHFTCTFADRRDDNANANANFEVWCDGERKFSSPILYHFLKESHAIDVDVSGCKELRFVFHCDYEVSTTENGYCYHGLCTPILTKNITDEFA